MYIITQGIPELGSLQRQKHSTRSEVRAVELERDGAEGSKTQLELELNCGLTLFQQPGTGKPSSPWEREEEREKEKYTDALKVTSCFGVCMKRSAKAFLFEEICPSLKKHRVRT